MIQQFKNYLWSYGQKILKSKYLYGCLLFSMYGLCNEIFFTGIGAWAPTFKGFVSLLMVPVYSISYLIISSDFYDRVEKAFPNIFVRSLFIVLVIYMVEGISGNIYYLMGLVPWQYKHGWASDFSNGAITLYYFPFWYVFSFIVVRVGDIVEVLAPVFEQLFFRETEDFWNDFQSSIEEIKKVI